MSRLLASGFLGVLVAEMIGVMFGWRWALPAAGVAVAVFGLQVVANLAAASRPAPAGAAADPALESLYRWKAQTESMLQWADATRGEWDRYLRPKLARDFLQATRQKDPAAVKAALDELFEHGRPTMVELAVLVDRGGRRMPIAADFTGLTLTAGEHEKVLVRLDPAAPERDSVTIVSGGASQSKIKLQKSKIP